MATEEFDPHPHRADPGRTVASFVITLWLEPSKGTAGSEWRWRVTEGQGGTTRYFRKLADLLSYVSERTDAPPPA